MEYDKIIWGDKMKFASYIESGFIFNDIEGNTKYDIITNMIERAAHHDPEIMKIKHKISAAVMKREDEISTVMPGGVMIPHARIDDYNDFVIITANLKKGQVFEAVGGGQTEVTTVFMILSGKDKNKLMLNIAAAITKLVRQPGNLEKLKKVDDRKDIVKIVEESGINVEAYMLAKDMMTNDVTPVKPDDVLEDVAKRFIIEGRDAFPVVDSNGNFLGDICGVDIVKTGIPAYADLLGDLSFLKDDDLFEEYLRKGRSCTVAEFINPNPIVVDEEISIVGISYKMTSRRIARVYVVKNKKYLGEINAKEIIKRAIYV